MGRKKMRWIAVGVALLGLLLVILSVNFRAFDVSGEKIYVATTGSDSNDGTIDRPFLTLTRAKSRVRQIKNADSTIPITVYLRVGSYFMATPLVLDADDSGSAGAPITYTSYPGEKAVITGAKTVNGFNSISDSTVLSRLPVAARANARVVNLPSLGITDYGTLEDRGGFLPTKVASLELFFNNNRMQLARYPNTGWDILGSGTSSVVNGFQYTDTRPASWPAYDDVFVSGLFSNTWADEIYKVNTINTENRTITITGTPDAYGFRAGQWFYYTNVLDELDAPGEYYLDRSTGNLYFWPPSNLDTASVTTSLSSKLVTGSDLRYVNFTGLTFAGTRSSLISITNSDHLKFSDNTFTGAGNDAIYLNNVTDTVLASNTASQLGESWLFLKGGDRTTLAGSNNVVINNLVHDTGQIVGVKPAVRIQGVGTKFLHNEMFNIPQSSVMYNGNDHIFSYNSFHNSVTLVPPDGQTADVGVIYSGRDFTSRGSVISHNSFKDIGAGHMISGAVYLDDVISGQIVEKNFFDNVGRALLLGGGRDNSFSNNVVVNSTRQMTFDSRGYNSPTRAEWMANKFYNPISAASNTTPIVITTTNFHGLVAGAVTSPSTIEVTDVSGNTAANGTWNFEVVSTNQLLLVGSVGNGDYTGGGDVRAPYGNIDLYATLDAVRYPGSPYEKYPNIFNYTKYDLGHPTGNTFDRNIFYFGNKASDTWVTMYPSTPQFFSPENNNISGSNGSPAIAGTNTTLDPQFTNLVAGDYRLKGTSPLLATGFIELPYEWMGKITTDQLLTVIPNKTLKVGENLDLTATSDFFATDQTRNPVFTASNLPRGATFNTTTKRLNWTPSSDQVGSYNITISVEDDNAMSSDQTFEITVTEADRVTGSSNPSVSSNSEDGTTIRSANQDPGPGDLVLPPVQTAPTPAPNVSDPVATVKEAVKQKVATVVNKEAIVASVATINSAVQDVLVNPISGRGTAKTTGRLAGILLVIVLPLVMAITIVILRRRARL